MAEVELDTLRQQTELLAKDLDALTFCVSHDLRAPLRSIGRFTEEVLADASSQLSPISRTDLNRVLTATHRMEQLIDDLLSLSRLSRRPMATTEVDLSGIAQRIAQELRQASPDRQVEVVIAPGLQAAGDAHLLEVVLRHLIGNAWKFSSKRAEARVEFGQTQHDGRAVFFVRDNGVGFDMKYAHKSFAPFQRLHTDAEFPGVGIGLATVQRAIQRHGGRVWPESQEGLGTTFYFSLPAVPVTPLP